jgi:hypothetical protein
MLGYHHELAITTSIQLFGAVQSELLTASVNKHIQDIGGGNTGILWYRILISYNLKSK